MIRAAALALAMLAPLIVGDLAWCDDLAAPSENPSRAVQAVEKFRSLHEKEVLAEFEALLEIPNLAADGTHIRQNATAIVRLLEARHIHTSLLEHDGAPPVILGDLPSPGATTTITFYAHYDGQPTDPQQWRTPPFEPTFRDNRLEDGGNIVDLATLRGGVDQNWRLYARSASDDKAPVIGLLAAVDALQAAGIAPAVNLKFFFEGEEEAGSPHLAEIFQENQTQLATDLWILCDGPIHPTGRQQVFFGARGELSLQVVVYGPNHGLHSGHYGNWAPNPISLLTHLLDSMRDTEARILIPGFYSDVRPLTSAEKEAVARDPNDLPALKQSLGFVRSEADPAPLALQLLKPAMNIRGIQGGHIGAAAANVIESEAEASIDFRLVPNQTPEHVRQLVEQHIAAQGYFIVHRQASAAERLQHARIAFLTWDRGYPGVRTSINAPLSKEFVAAVESAAGTEVVQVPALGGSIPMYLFVGAAQHAVVGLPIANYDNNQHTANENIRMGTFWDGIKVYAGVMANMGRSSLR